MKLCASASLAILLIVFGAQAAETGGLRGTVRDESGKPVTGAAVKIRHAERGVTVTVFSRAGNYSAPELFPGKHEVFAAPGGHEESMQAEVQIAAGKTASLDLTLSALYGYRLNWQTTFYVGYGDFRLLDESQRLLPNRRSLFMKASYAFQK